MLGVSGMMGSSGDGVDAAAEAHESGGASGGSSEVGGSSSIPGGGGGGGLEELNERSGGAGGNRWPRQETLALLKIRSEMDVAFRDASLKGPLWEEVSRKMAELGFQRSAKKCKEKFENVYKYHKRTRGDRASKSDGKTYRFFDQLEALENNPPNPFTPPPPPTRPQPPPATPMEAAPPENASNFPPPPPHTSTVSSTSPTPLSVVFPTTTPLTSTTAAAINPPFQQSQPPLPPVLNYPQIHNHQFMTHPHNSTSPVSNSTSSSSTSSDEDIQMQRGRKRKWKDYFAKLMKDVVSKQEELQKKFLDALEKRERDRMAREEAWRSQEIGRITREHELLAQERSIAAAKDAAVIAFLQKVADQHNLQIPFNNTNTPPPPQPAQPPPPENPQPERPQPPPPPRPQQPTTVPPPVEQPPPPPQPVLTVTPTKTDNGGVGDNYMPPSSSRWPKAEVQALINLRTSLDIKYQESGPKGPLWEEISASMSKLGYNRSSKRCKEKWENINKYYKKVKESNKKRPEDSKTCPYFHMLEAIYKEKAKPDNSFNNNNNPMAPIMARPEQQWPLPQQHQQQQDSIMHDRDHDNESENIHEDEDDDEEDEDEDEGGGYEIIANKQPSSLANSAE